MPTTAVSISVMLSTLLPYTLDPLSVQFGVNLFLSVTTIMHVWLPGPVQPVTQQIQSVKQLQCEASHSLLSKCGVETPRFFIWHVCIRTVSLIYHYLHTYLLTPWSTVLEKLTSFQLVRTCMSHSVLTKELRQVFQQLPFLLEAQMLCTVNKVMRSCVIKENLPYWLYIHQYCAVKIVFILFLYHTLYFKHDSLFCFPVCLSANIELPPAMPTQTTGPNAQNSSNKVQL
jgi:hypothetical protein